MLAKLLQKIALGLSTLAIASCLALSWQDLSALAAGNLDNGSKVFQATCVGCHAQGGNIVRRGKNLKLKALHKNKVDTQEAIEELVTNGKGIMSAYGDKLTQQEITDVSAYVLQRAEQNWK